MWLPKDERRLLQGYYLKIGQVQRELTIPAMRDWISIMKSRPRCMKQTIEQLEQRPTNSIPNNTEGNNDDLGQLKKDIKQVIEDDTRIITANKALRERGLIIYSQGDIEQQLAASATIRIALTISGYDLGRKYNSLLERSHLWFVEYKDNWIWLILSFLGGVMGALLVNWLLSLFTKSSGC